MLKTAAIHAYVRSRSASMLSLLRAPERELPLSVVSWPAPLLISLGFTKDYFQSDTLPLSEESSVSISSFICI